MTNEHLPSDREPGTGKVDVDKCLDILRDIVANAENGHRLTRYLINEFKPESRLSEIACPVPAELIESAMKALGLPYPKAPKPRKVPSLPSATQAAALQLMLGVYEGKRPRLVRYTHVGGYRSSYWVEAEDNPNVRESTFSALHDYKWIERTSDDGGYRHAYYVITHAGRDALSRYQAKHSGAGRGDTDVPQDAGSVSP